MASSYFKLERGVRKGCPLSPCLCIIAAETLAVKSRQNNDIHRIRIGNKFVRLDSMLMRHVFSLFEDFSTRSGHQINYTKTEVFRIGAIKTTIENIEMKNQLKWTNDCADMLGNTVSTKMNEMMMLNIDPLIEKKASSKCGHGESWFYMVKHLW